MLAAVGFLALLVSLPLIVPALLAKLSAFVTVPMQRAWTFSGRLAPRTIRSSRARVARVRRRLALVAAAFVGLKGMTGSLRGEIEEWAIARSSTRCTCAASRVRASRSCTRC